MNTVSTTQPHKKRLRPAKECAYLSTFVALLIAVQVAFSSIPGVELVTVLLAAFSFALGAKRGAIAAAAFCLLRQLVFGFFPNVLLLYLLYYPSFAVLFGFLGKKIHHPLKAIVVITAIAALATALFTLTDNVLTPLWYGYSKKAAQLYFNASFPFLIPQVISACVSVAALFLPLCSLFQKLRNSLES